MTTENWKYLPLKGLLHAIAWMPFWVLYGLADIIFVILYLIIGYRKRVVSDNLRNSFPEKSADELKKIRRQFYRNFADYIVETIKLLHVSDKEMKKRMTFSGVDIIDDALENGQPVVCYFAHLGNWEWAPSITLHSRLRPDRDAAFCQIYRPLRNQWFDATMLQLRSRFGSHSLPKRRAFLDLMRYAKQGMPTVTGFMSDQKPSHGDTLHVLNFLHHPTAVITGTEIVCNRLKALPVYWHMTKPSRGHYHITVIPINLQSSNPADATPGSNLMASDSAGSNFPLTDRYAELLEQNIRQTPALWLWSHKRWKHPVTFDMNGQTLM
jgi:KDO2-lipid IV(A) lauroyltransferase